MDLTIYDPAGAVSHHEESVSETEVAVSADGLQVG